MLLLAHLSYSQQTIENRGTVIREKVNWKSIENNTGGESSIRGLSVYLPYSYNNNLNKRYPVIYYLHGFTRNDSTVMSGNIPDDIDDLLDHAIHNNSIKEVILVVADHCTEFNGSFYTNSELTGNWEDFASTEVVNYVDNKYRTIAHRDSRGIFGHSMGGYGTMRVAMRAPETFGVVYAMSAPMMATNEDNSPLNNPAYKSISQAKSKAEITADIYVMVSLARTFSPNLSKEPFMADFPVEYIEGKPTLYPDISKKWRNEVITNKLHEQGADNLKKLNAFKLDWGRNDPITSIPVGNRKLSKILEELGVEHFAEEYLGRHWDKLLTYEGRYSTEVFPFFNRYLKF